MEIVTLANAPFYTVPNYEGVTARRLQGGEGSSADFAWVGYSEVPPGMIVSMDAGPIGEVYVVKQGRLTIEQEVGVRNWLHEWDSILIAAHEARAIVNDGEDAAAFLVITPPPAITYE